MAFDLFNLSFQEISLIIFLLLLISAIFIYRKKMDFQRMLFPLFYAGLFRTGFGLKWMDRFSNRYKEWIILSGYIGIGFGFVGMIFVTISIIHTAIRALMQPAAEAGVAIVLPQTNIPGIGFLPFWYWIIALFVLVVIHEFAHGIVARAHGLKIKSSGVGFFGIGIPLIPLAFVEPDEKEITKASDHVQYSIYAAGPFSNILTAALVLLMFVAIFNPVDSTLTDPDGFTFEKINESYPSSVLPDDFTIRSFNGNSVETAQDFLIYMQGIDIGEEITLSDGVEEFALETVQNPISEGAFIGITNIENQQKLNEGVSEFWFNVYSWFKGLFKWIGLLSFAIGLMNLLPLGPIDGGRMVKTFTEKLYKDKEKALKHWGLISFIMLILLLMTLFPLIRGLF